MPEAPFVGVVQALYDNVMRTLTRSSPTTIFKSDLVKKNSWKVDYPCARVGPIVSWVDN